MGELDVALVEVFLGESAELTEDLAGMRVGERAVPARLGDAPGDGESELYHTG